MAPLSHIAKLPYNSKVLNAMNSEIPNQQILEGAKYYYEAYKLLRNSDPCWALLPAIHCAAIAMELYLKSLCGKSVCTHLIDEDVYVVTAESPHGHILPDLYKEAPKRFRDKLDEKAFCNERICDYLKQEHAENIQNEFFHIVLVKLDGRLFMPSRYPYDKKCQSISGLPIDIISDILEILSTVCYNKK